MRKSLIYNWWLSGGDHPYTTAWLRKLDEEEIERPSALFITELNRFYRSISPLINDLENLKMTLMGVDGQELVDFINPSANLITYPVGLADKAQNGWKPNGTTEYINLQLDPSTAIKYLRNSASRFVFIEEAPTIGDVIDGATGNTMRHASTTAQRICSGSNNANSAIDLSDPGLIGLTRSDATNISGYDDATKVDRTQTSVDNVTSTTFLFRSGATYSNMRVSMWLRGGFLNESQVSLFRAAYEALRIGVGLVIIAGSSILAGSELHTAGGEFL